MVYTRVERGKMYNTTRSLTVRISPRFINNRQDLIKFKEAHGVKAEKERLDMYWLDAFVTDYNLTGKITYSVEPAYPFEVGSWILTKQYGSDMLNTPEIHNIAMMWWNTSPARAKADIWLRRLITAGAI